VTKFILRIAKNLATLKCDQIIAMVVINLVTFKAVAKLEHLFNKAASDTSLLNTRQREVTQQSVTNFITMILTNVVVNPKHQLS
jgi:hypothetical protein